MSLQKQLSASILVSAQTEYQELESNPGLNKYIFKYKIKIENKSAFPVQLLGRHWVIKDALGRIEEVKGSGVVGQQPRLNPGGIFEYESFCPLNTTTGSMRGWYEFLTETSDRFLAEIPEFYFFDTLTLH